MGTTAGSEVAKTRFDSAKCQTWSEERLVEVRMRGTSLQLTLIEPTPLERHILKISDTLCRPWLKEH